jgi:hypothetical protein
MAASFGVILDNATAKGVREHGRGALLDELQAVASRRWTEQQGLMSQLSRQPRIGLIVSANFPSTRETWTTCIMVPA